VPREALVGIDVGTTVLKAAAFCAVSGRPLATSVQRLKVQAHGDGRREQDPRKLTAALWAGLQKLRRELGPRWAGVSGIGLAAQGGSSVIVERETGKPLSAMILWNDARAYPYMQKLSAEKGPEYWRSFSWRDGPGAGLGRIRWMREHTPDLIRPDTLYVGAGEFLYHQLTGQWRQDVGNVLQIGCYDVGQDALTQAVADLAGVSIDWCAPLRRGHEAHGLCAAAAKKLGLDSSTATRVVGPYMDHEAGYMAAAGASQRPVQCSLGTAWVANFVMPPGAAWQSAFQLVLPSPMGAGHLVVQPLLTGNVTWDWALTTFLGGSHAIALSRYPAVFKQSILPVTGVAALPWLSRPDPLDASRLGGAALYGLSPQTDTADMLRAVAAAMPFELVRVLRQVMAAGCVDGVVLGGGASKAEVFRQILTALWAPLPVWRVAEEDASGCRGALHALNAKVAAVAVKPAVGAPSTKLAAQVAGHFARYLRLFDKLYGDSPLGGAVQVQSGVKP